VKPRLWVTGLGTVTPLGVGLEKTWSRLVRGDRAIRPVQLFDVSGQRSDLAAEVDGIVTPIHPPGAWSRTSAMALAAVAEAMTMARLRATDAVVGLVVGGTTSGMFETEHLLAQFHAHLDGRDVPLAMLSHPMTATGDRVDERWGPFARVRTLASACSSGANAIAVGAAWLLSGQVDAVVAGGSDGLCRLTFTGFNSLGALDRVPCRPFDRRRRGTSLGEGAGFLVLERAEDAKARGAAPIAELAGWAMGSEAHHITDPDPHGEVVAKLIERAIERAGISPSEIDYVNAHGTGTPANDSMECAALKRALGSDLARIPVSSSKGQIGHTLGAAGGIEAVVTALVVSRKTLVPTAGLDEPDPSIDLLHVPHVGREVARVRAALSNAFGFGGLATVLVFTPCDPPAPVSGVGDRPVPLGCASIATGVCDPPAAPVSGVGDRPAPSGCASVVTGVSVVGSAGSMGAEGCADLLSGLRIGAAAVDPDTHLDAARARRLDRTSKLATLAVEQALRDARATAAGSGVVLGSAFGAADASAAFLYRVFQKGPRAASPSEFPNLVPSSAVGHVSIYLGMRGPALAVADLAASADCAFAQAVELVEGAESARVVVVASEPGGDIVRRVLSPLCSDAALQAAGPSRSDLAAAIAIETAAAARGRGAPILAHVAQRLQWRGDGSGSAGAVRPPTADRAEVVVARSSPAVDAFLARTGWGDQPRVSCADRLGENGALGAVAIAIAAARVGTGRAPEALVLGLERGRGYAIVLAAA
jgi:3-oxoacyl-[acyl-carrier-protein] synthase II